MKVELLIALAATAISILSLVVAIWTSRQQFHAQTWVSNQQALAEIETLLGNVPSVLRFHGIDENELKEAGLTAQEFAYVLASFTAGGIYYRNFTSMSSKPFPPGSYRYNMCYAAATRRAWPVLRRMMTQDQYCDRIDATIKQAERETSSARAGE